MENKIFILKDKKDEAPGVFTLEFVAERDGFNYKAGQFAIFKILKGDFLNKPGKSYTIISLPSENSLIITVKRMGAFSNALCDLKIGDRVGAAGPYGNFYPIESSNGDIVFLAGGIGITPFYAIIKDLYKRGVNKNLVLFYSNRERPDIVFFKEFEKLASEWKNLKIIHILTREKEKFPYVQEYERLNIEMIKKYLGDLEGRDYFICGPSNFVSDMKDQLKNTGIGQDSIKIEAFY